MENLKDFIEDNRKEFEKEDLLLGHRDRFLRKIGKTTSGDKSSIHIKRSFWAVAAAILIIFVTITTFVTDKSELKRSGVSYSQLIKKKSNEITKQALLFNPSDQNIVLSTLAQLEFESVPFEDQLPATISPKEKEVLLKSYYIPKLEGIERLEKYMADLKKSKI